MDCAWKKSLLLIVLALGLIAWGVSSHIALRGELAAARTEFQSYKDSLKSTRVLKRVIDGDTIIMGDGERVRILGIDAAETHKRVRGKWVKIENPDPQGIAAHEWLAGFEGRQVRLSYCVKRHDKYGRTLAHVYIEPDGPDVACELLRRGLVKVMAIPPNTARYGQWRDAAASGKQQS